jgi:predicted Zn-dependent protease
MRDEQEELLKVARRAVSLALSGAEVAEASAGSSWDLSARVRLGQPELVEEAGQRGVSLRVLRGGRLAMTSTSDLSASGVERLVKDALELADLCESDPLMGPAPKELIGQPPYPDLDLFDEGIASIEDEASKKRRGYYWTAKRHLTDLEDETFVGQEATRRTLAKLGARKVPTGTMPVVFDADAARSILGTFAGPLLGSSLWRRSSYLLDRLGTQVASPLVTIIDDPLIPRGPGSRSFDGEGLTSRRNYVVKEGRLETYLLDCYSARKLGLEPTASASRSGGAIGPSTTNFILQAGETSAADVIARTERGLLVTEMMGFGFNAITGDFSRGAAGFFIENGRLTFPVSEVTISSNLDRMLQGIDLVGDDLELKSSTASPSFRVDAMTISGS